MALRTQSDTSVRLLKERLVSRLKTEVLRELNFKTKLKDEKNLEELRRASTVGL